MLHHIDFPVADLARSRTFYEHALAPLGLAMTIAFSNDAGRQLVGFGIPASDPMFWIRDGGPVGGCLHVAFATATRAVVDAFHAAALQAGGTDNGAPGFRPRYGGHWYAAFVLDPDGHNVEAVCRVQDSKSLPRGDA